MNDSAQHGPAVPGMPEDGPVLTLHGDLPAEMEVGPGQFLMVSGECRGSHGGIREVVVEVGTESKSAELSRASDGVAFWQAVYLDAGSRGRSVPVDIRVRTDGGSFDYRMGRIACREVDWRPAGVPDRRGGQGLVAICMATYSPDLKAFKRQVDSIRAQTYDNWICIVNDDGSPAQAWRAMRESCDGDERFMFFQNPENLGFYGNFERLLTRVPEQAEYVAYSDQDDYWYPDKLSRLVEKIRDRDATLVYSDMRIVDAAGSELSSTYWVNRRNEYRDLQVVLVANTVTGAASLFRRELLPYLVPFPPRVGDAFHDHWLACVALSVGRIEYVDAPLHDYYQHGTSVIGHCDFVRFTIMQRIASFFRFCFRMCRPGVAGPLLKSKYVSALAVYRGECRRLRLVEATIRRRCPLEERRRRQLRLFEGGLGSIVKLLRLHLMILIRRQTTDDAELRLALGETARFFEQRRRAW